MMQAFRGAFARLKARLFLSQWVGNFLLMLLAAGWLQIPDSHSWQFVFSMLSGVLLVAAFLWLYTATFRHLRVCAVAASLVAELFAAGRLCRAVVVAADADCRRSRERGSLCRLSKFSIPAVAACSFRLFKPCGLAGTYL